MVKKIIFLTSLVLLAKGYSFGQNCIPDPQYTNTSTQKGTHPDTIVNLTQANAGTPYSQTITIVVPPDTTVPILGTIVWDSTVLTGITGLPAGFTYACSNSSAKPNLCSWKGNSIGCVIITGTPGVADIGTHPLQFMTSNYIAGSTAANPYTVKGYKIIVNPANAANENPNIQIIEQNNPNPFEDKTEILFTAEDFGTAQFKVYNMVGTAVQEYDIAVKKGVNKLVLDAKDFDSGIYFYALVNGKNAFTRKMIVKK